MTHTHYVLHGKPKRIKSDVFPLKDFVLIHHWKLFVKIKKMDKYLMKS